MRVTPLFHLAIILIAITGAYLWLSSPYLHEYSLQAFCVTIVLYLLVRRVAARSIWEVAPRVLSLELSLLTFAFLLVIGFTGNFESLLFPLTYAHLLLVVFTTSSGTAIATAFAVVLFHYALTPNLELRTILELSTIPVSCLFFLFAKQQYISNQEKQQLLEAAKEQVSILESHLEDTIREDDEENEDVEN